MQPPGNQGALTEPNTTIHHQNALGTAREPYPRRRTVPWKGRNNTEI